MLNIETTFCHSFYIGVVFVVNKIKIGSMRWRCAVVDPGSSETAHDQKADFHCY